MSEKVNTHYKDTVFRMLFREKRRLLGLYNAVSGRDYVDPEIMPWTNASSRTF